MKKDPIIALIATVTIGLFVMGVVSVLFGDDRARDVGLMFMIFSMWIDDKLSILSKIM